MDIFLKIELYTYSKDELLQIMHDLVKRIETEPDDGCGQWRYEFTNIPKEEDL
jgi:hypothetical protein